MATPLPESERKKDFYRKIILLQSKYADVYKIFVEISQMQTELLMEMFEEKEKCPVN